MKNIKRYTDNLEDISDTIISELIRTNKKYKTTIFVLLSLLIISIAFIIGISVNKNKEIEDLNVTIQNDEEILCLEYSIGYWFINQPDTLSDSTLYNFLLENNAWYPEILLKQAKIESGNYTSNLCKNYNNLFGMRTVRKRQTTQIGEINGYGIYSNWCLSVLDRLLWDEYAFKKHKPTKEEYLKAMHIYAEDSSYLKKIK